MLEKNQVKETKQKSAPKQSDISLVPSNFHTQHTLDFEASTGFAFTTGFASNQPPDIYTL
jgi:hypothetical protein